MEDRKVDGSVTRRTVLHKEESSRILLDFGNFPSTTYANVKLNTNQQDFIMQKRFMRTFFWGGGGGWGT